MVGRARQFAALILRPIVLSKRPVDEAVTRQLAAVHKTKIPVHKLLCSGAVGQRSKSHDPREDDVLCIDHKSPADSNSREISRARHKSLPMIPCVYALVVIKGAATCSLPSPRR